MAEITTTKQYEQFSRETMFEEYPTLIGIYVGGCVERGEGSSFRAIAHAHTDKRDLYHNWICVRSGKRLYTGSGKPSQIMLHELAHILSGHGHTDKWRAMAREVGYRVPRHYLKHARKGRGVRRTLVMTHSDGSVTKHFMPKR